MWVWIIQTSIISLCFIALVHHLWHFLGEQLTIPKIKDLIDETPVYHSTPAIIPIQSIHVADNIDPPNELIDFMKIQMSENDLS